MTDIKDLLARLPSPSETDASATFDGRALSRDETHLHLSGPSGVVAIPLTDIVEVRPLFGGTPDLVSVDVRDRTSVAELRSFSAVSTERRSDPVSSGLGGGGFGRGWGSSLDTYTVDYLDSATVSGGRLDSTDDTFPIAQVDDHWA